MRIAFTTDYYPPHLGGGVEVVASEIARRLAKWGHDVLVVTLESGGTELDEVSGVRVHGFPSVSFRELTGLELRISPAASRSMGDVLSEFGPDVINAHHLYFSTTRPALRWARKLSVPSVLTLHVAGMESFSGWRGTAARLFEKSIGRRLMSRANRIVAVSSAVADSVPIRHRGRVNVVYNGVDIDHFHPPLGEERAGNRVVFVGRLIANKGPQILLRAFNSVLAEAPDSMLTFVGDGPMRSQLEQQAHDNGTAHAVHFAGMTSDVAVYLRQSDIFARPSLIEGFPLTVLEAMASGLPVVVTNVGGVREIVEDGLTGYVVAPGESEPVGRVLLELLRDAQLRGRMGDAGRMAVEEGFSWDDTARATEATLTEVVSG